MHQISLERVTHFFPMKRPLATNRTELFLSNLRALRVLRGNN